jgi:hypothetical protein
MAKKRKKRQGPISKQEAARRKAQAERMRERNEVYWSCNKPEQAAAAQGRSGTIPEPPIAVQAALTVAEVVPLAENTGYEEMVRWVADNVDRKVTPPGDPLAREVLQWARDDRAGFREKMIAPLFKKAQERADAQVDEGMEASTKLLDDWIKEYQETYRQKCPKCGYEEDYSRSWEGLEEWSTPKSAT